MKTKKKPVRREKFVPCPSPTPAPWKVIIVVPGCAYRIAPSADSILEAEWNRSLIEAAPDMVEVLHKALVEVDTDADGTMKLTRKIVAKMRAAVKKAGTLR